MKNTLLTIIIGVGLIAFQAHGKTHKTKTGHSAGYSRASQYFQAKSLPAKKSRDVASEKKKKSKKKSVAKKTKKSKKRHASTH